MTKKLFGLLLTLLLLIGAAPEEGKKAEAPLVRETVELVYGIDGVATKQVRRVRKKKPAGPVESVKIALPAAPGGEKSPETAELKVKRKEA